MFIPVMLLSRVSSLVSQSLNLIRLAAARKTRRFSCLSFDTIEHVERAQD